MNSIIPMESGLAAAVSIPQNTDLNDLTTPGAYYALSSSIAQSLIHCPTSSAFSMLVLKKGGDPVVTQILTTGDNLWFRGRTSGGWGHWFVVTKTDTGS